jgi:excisionase family DNA binding protein
MQRTPTMRTVNVNTEQEKLAVKPARAALLLDMSRSKVYELVAAGVLPSIRLGGGIRIPIEALRRLIEAGSEESPS